MLFLLLAACTAPPDSDKDSAGDTAPVTAYTPTAITAEVTPDVATVVRVTWQTETATTGQVLFGEDTSYALTSPLETTASTQHEALLLGVPADTDVHFRILSTTPDGAETSEDTTVRTGNLPGEMPSLTRTGDPDPYGGFLSLPIIGTYYAATFIDTQGRVVWYHPEERAGYTIQRVRLAHDGQSVLYNAVWLSDLTPNGEIVRVSLDGATVTTYPAPRTTHDFVELPDGTFAAIYTDIRTVDGADVYGDAIAIIGLDGSFTTLWSAFDSYDPITEPALNSSDATWTHFNVLHYSPEEDAFYVGIRNFNSIVKLDHATATPIWTLGGYHDDYTWSEGTEPFTGQHGFQLQDDGTILVFDNGPASDASSAGVEYTLDQDAHVITEDWEVHHDPPYFVWAMGDMDRRADGGTRITWSTSGAITQLDADQNVQWELVGGFGTLFGYSSWHPSLYDGASAPY